MLPTPLETSWLLLVPLLRPAGAPLSTTRRMKGARNPSLHRARSRCHGRFRQSWRVKHASQLRDTQWQSADAAYASWAGNLPNSPRMLELASALNSETQTAMERGEWQVPHNLVTLERVHLSECPTDTCHNVLSMGLRESPTADGGTTLVKWHARAEAQWSNNNHAETAHPSTSGMRLMKVWCSVNADSKCAATKCSWAMWGPKNFDALLMRGHSCPLPHS